MKEFLVKCKIVFDRGKAWINYLSFLMIVFITVSSMKNYTWFSFLSGRHWLIILLIGSLVFIFIIGWLEVVKLRIYQKESEIYGRINPVFQRIMKNQEEILKTLKESEKQK